jgi:hypothetical protein
MVVPGQVDGGEAARRATLAGADLASKLAEGPCGDAPADPGDGLGVRPVPVQHAGGQGAAERLPAIVRRQRGTLLATTGRPRLSGWSIDAGTAAVPVLLAAAKTGG